MTVETQAGTLYVEVMNERWTHCRFLDVGRANVYFGNTERLLGKYLCPNPFTGKWNWHGPDHEEQYQTQVARILLEPAR